MAKDSDSPRRRVLPPSLPPKGLSRIEAAAFIGISPNLFDQLVADGRMPQPKLINARVIWDRVKVETYFEALPEREPAAGDPNYLPRDSFEGWSPGVAPEPRSKAKVQAKAK